MFDKNFIMSPVLEETKFRLQNPCAEIRICVLQKILKKHQAANFDLPLFVFLHNFVIGAQV